MNSMDPLLMIPLVIGLILLVMFANYLNKQRKEGRTKPTWPALAKRVDGTAEADGLKGTYEGKPIRVSVKQDKQLLMPNPFESGFTRQELGGWVYRLTMSVPPRGQSWTISYDGRITTTSGPLPEDFIERFQMSGRELDFGRIGPGQLILDGQTGALTLERYFPVHDGPAAKAGSTVAVPTFAQFDAQLALMTETIKMA